MDEARAAWVCDHCQCLIYNRDCAGRPAEGAPQPHFVSVAYKEVCCTCFQLSVIADNDYWRDVERELRQKRDRKIEQIKKLNGDKDYFSGL
jgi:hypothetical protein